MSLVYVLLFGTLYIYFSWKRDLGEPVLYFRQMFTGRLRYGVFR